MWLRLHVGYLAVTAQLHSGGFSVQSWLYMHICISLVVPEDRLCLWQQYRWNSLLHFSEASILCIKRCLLLGVGWLVFKLSYFHIALKLNAQNDKSKMAAVEYWQIRYQVLCVGPV